MQAYAVIGYPLKHTRSPFLHRLVYEAWQLPHTYLTWEVTAGELGQAVAMFRRNLAGFNVTIPHKKAIMRYLDGLDFSAELYGAVNTVKNENGQLIGYNTDGVGFLRGLDDVDYKIAGKQILLLGAGGAAQTIALELAHQGCQITIANREVSNAYALQLLLERRFPGTWLEVANLDRVPQRPYAAVINATPVGMGELMDRSPLDPRHLPGIELVYDLIYNPPTTKLLNDAKRAGCKTVNGLTMLVYQGLRAAEIWFERSVDTQLEAEIVHRMAREVYQ